MECKFLFDLFYALIITRLRRTIVECKLVICAAHNFIILFEKDHSGM